MLEHATHPGLVAGSTDWSQAPRLPRSDQSRRFRLAARIQDDGVRALARRAVITQMLADGAGDPARLERLKRKLSFAADHHFGVAEEMRSSLWRDGFPGLAKTLGDGLHERLGRAIDAAVGAYRARRSR